MKNESTKIQRLFWSELFVIFVLIALFFVEWITFHYLKLNNENSLFASVTCELCIMVIGWLILSFIIIVGIVSKSYIISMQIVKRFLNNALGLRWLSFVFILVFLVHVSWISTTSYYFFIDTSGGWPEILVAVVGICVLFIIFPLKKSIKERDNKDSRTLLVTGMTVPVSKKSIDLLLKPFEESSGYNNIQDVVILLSDGLYRKTAEEPALKKLREIQSLCKDEATKNSLAEFIPTVNKFSKGTEADISELVTDICETSALKENFIKSVDDNDFDRLKNAYKEILNTCIRVKYPSYKNKVVNFHFTDEFYNYNNLESCYKGLGEILKKYEDKSKKGTSGTLIHISPGTALISSIMAIYAIKENRTLLYTSQSEGKLTPFELDVWTTEEVLNELWKELDE